MKKVMPMVVMALIMLVSLLFAIQGISMHTKVKSEEANLHALQEKYFSLDKATRDTAPTNSELNKQLVEIQKYPSELLRLKLVGVGKILVGIYILLFGILIALIIMPTRLGQMIQSKK
jgi:hypothetical protein